jgi:hypothetical protein
MQRISQHILCFFLVLGARNLLGASVLTPPPPVVLCNLGRFFRRFLHYFSFLIFFVCGLFFCVRRLCFFPQANACGYSYIALRASIYNNVPLGCIYNNIPLVRRYNNNTTRP